MNTNEVLKQLNRLILHESAQKFALARLEDNELKYPHQKNYLIGADLIASIEGKKSIGVMLAQDKTYLCKAGAIDIDIPRDAKNLSEGLVLVQRLQETALKLNLKGFIEFSGNRGYHLWIFANKPIYASLMQLVLKAIVFGANFDYKEIFPNSIPESKCIKLPCSIHLKSDRRCGFIDEDFDPNNPQINLNNQAKLMAEFEQNFIETLTTVANLTPEKHSGSFQYNNYKDSQNNTNYDYQNSNKSNFDSYSPNCNTSKIQVNQEEIKEKLNSFGDNHPSCITYLLNYGSPLDIDYNQTNLTLVRYCLSRDIELKEAIALAELMAKFTPDNHPTSKDYYGKIANFKSAYNSASRNKSDYGFDCGYVLANLKGQKLETRGCIGSKCSLFKPKNDSSKDSSTPEYYPLNRFIFEAMITLLEKDIEICKSLILTEVENLINASKLEETNNFIKKIEFNCISESAELREAETLAYFLKLPDLLLDNLDLFPQGFITLNNLSNLKISDYLDYLLNLKLPSENTLHIHLDSIRNLGIKAVAKQNLKQYDVSLDNQDPVDALTESIEETENLLKRSLNDEEILPVSDRLSKWTCELLAEDRVAIPTNYQDLDYLLNGGFSKSRLYVLGSPPANGKSTVCLQLAERACQQGFRVVYVSYEMSASQIFLTSLSRLGRINSDLFEAKKFNQDSKLKDTLLNLIAQYNELIAPNLHIIEADDNYTPNRLLAIVKKLKADLLIVDYLQLMTTGDEKLDNAYQETLRVSKIATELKRLSRKADIPVIAISDINKNAYTEALKGGDLDMGALRDSFKIAHSADVIILLISNNITQIVKDSDGNKSQVSITQLGILAEKMRIFSLEISQKIEQLAYKYKLDKARADTYSRLIIAKNRTGRCGELLFRYSKAIHLFESLDYLTTDVNFNY